jgi:hypothetical protein
VQRPSTAAESIKIFPLQKEKWSGDGILGHHFDKRLKSFAPPEQKPDSTLVFKIQTKKNCETRKLEFIRE